MPAVRGDGMRGLAVFISDIRNCKYECVSCSAFPIISIELLRLFSSMFCFRSHYLI